MVMSPEFQKVDHQRQAAKECWQIVILQAASDGFTSIGANWLDPIVLPDQEEGKFASAVNP
jgi:hypothetical protein